MSEKPHEDHSHKKQHESSIPDDRQRDVVRSTDHTIRKSEATEKVANKNYETRAKDTVKPPPTED